MKELKMSNFEKIKRTPENYAKLNNLRAQLNASIYGTEEQQIPMKEFEKQIILSNITYLTNLLNNFYKFRQKPKKPIKKCPI